MEMKAHMDRIASLRPVIDVLVLLAFGLPPLLLIKIAEPFQRGFYCSDTTIRYPFRKSTVNQAVLYGVGYGLSTLIILVVELLRVYKFEKGLDRSVIKPCQTYRNVRIPPILGRLYYFWGYFFMGALATICVTNIGKFGVGRLRPNFLDVCQPDWSKISCQFHGPGPNTSSEFKGEIYVTDPHCTVDHETERSSRLSFPSGHSSFSFYAAVFSAIYVQIRASGLLDYLVTPILQILLVILALLTGISRIADHKHHWSDVCAGAILGTVSAIIFSIYIGKFHNLPPYMARFEVPRRWWFQKYVNQWRNAAAERRAEEGQCEANENRTSNSGELFRTPPLASTESKENGETMEITVTRDRGQGSNSSGASV